MNLLGIISVGLAKDIAELKKTPLEANRDRKVLDIARTPKGYLSMDPGVVDRYYSFVEECYLALLPEIDNIDLNVSRWRDGFIAVDADAKHAITKCDLQLWLCTWGTGEAQKAAAVWQYVAAAVKRSGRSRSLSIQNLKLLVKTSSPRNVSAPSNETLARSASVEFVENTMDLTNRDDEHPVSSPQPLGAGLQALYDDIDDGDDGDDVDSWPSCPFDSDEDLDLEVPVEDQLQIAPDDVVEISDTDEDYMKPQGLNIPILDSPLSTVIAQSESALRNPAETLGKARGHGRGRGRGKGSSRGKKKKRRCGNGPWIRQWAVD